MPTGRGERLIAGARKRLDDGGAGLPILPLLGLLCAASAAMIVVLGTRLAFFNDDWYFLLQRPALPFWDSILEPHNEHLSAISALTFKGLVAVFGLDDQLPFRILLAAVVVSLGIGVFVFVRDRVGPLLGLVAAGLLLFLGPAWEDLLFFSSVNLIGSLALGVAVLIVLERDSGRRNLLACALLVTSMALSSLAVPFSVAGGVAVLLRRRPVQLWIPAAPAAVFAAWWLSYGHEAPSRVTAGNVARVPEYVADSIGSGLSSLVGLTFHSGATLDTSGWGPTLLGLAVVGVAIFHYRGARPAPYLLVIAAAAFSFWILAGFNYIEGRDPQASRYQLVSATFVILLAAELFRSLRPSPGLLAGILVAALIAAGANIGALNDGYRFLHREGQLARADLGAMEIAEGRVPLDYQLVEPVAHSPFLTGVTAAEYYRETDAHGPASYDTPREIAAAAPDIRQAADNVLAAGYQLGLAPVPRATATGSVAESGCRRLAASPYGGSRGLELAPGDLLITNLGSVPVDIGVRRFAPPNLPIKLGRVVPAFAVRLSLPADELRRPWHLSVTGESPLEVCAG